MKRILLLAVTLFFINSVFSQERKWGIKVGGNLSGLSDQVEKYPKDDIGYHNTQKDGSGLFPGFHIGAFANVYWSRRIHFQPELQFSLQGGKHKRNVGYGGPIWQHLLFKFGYVQLPLLLEIKPISNLGIL